MQIPANRLQRDYPITNIMLYRELVRGATQREAGYNLLIPNTAPQIAKSLKQRVGMRR
jgi:hypothetical protein